MTDYTLRVLIFFSVLSVLLIWQWCTPRATLEKWKQRWYHNLLLFLSGVLVVRFVQPFLLALLASITDLGLLSSIDLSTPVAIALGVLLLDLTVYWQHRLFHTVPALWRLHRVHHTDPELDVSSAIRFHPLEILASLLIKSIAILVFGIPAVAILIFDILLNAASLFNHTNARLPRSIETIVRMFIVTPDHHRIHHSRVTREANSNYAFFLTIWDHVFRSYTHESHNGDQNLSVGLPQTHHYEPRRITSLLSMPFWSDARIQKEVKGER